MSQTTVSSDQLGCMSNSFVLGCSLYTLYGAKALVYIDGTCVQLVDTRSSQYELVVGWTYAGPDPPSNTP